MISVCFQVSYGEMVLCDNIKTRIDLRFSKPGPEPTMTDLMWEIRRRAGIKRSEVWARQGRNALAVDAVTPKAGESEDANRVPAAGNA